MTTTGLFPLTALLASEGAKLSYAVRTHEQCCECEDCESLWSIWAALPAEGQAAMMADIAKREAEELLDLAIRTVIARDDSADLPDVSTQVTALIMTDETFAPLRERIYSSLFDA